jgi:hypothetical protein
MPYHNDITSHQVARTLEVLQMADTLIQREIISSLTLYNELNVFIHTRLDDLHYLVGRSWDEAVKRLEEKNIKHLLDNHTSAK